MKVEATGKDRANIVFTRHEWENYGNTMGWNARLAKENGKIKTAGSPSIKLVANGDEHQVSMNYEGWRALGKRAQFFDEDDDYDYREESIGEQDYYADFDIDDSEGPDTEMQNLLSDVGDIDESELAQDDAADEAFDTTIEALQTTLVGITDEKVSEHGVPYLILSALEPVSEFRDIDMSGDPTEAISRYLSREPDGEKETSVMRMVKDALSAAGIEVGENVI